MNSLGVRRDTDLVLDIVTTAMRETITGTWVGNVAALQQRAGQRSTTSMLWPNAVSPDNLRTRLEDGTPVAWSCWDLCVAVSHRVAPSLRGLNGSVATMHARGAEEHATAEPHGLLMIATDVSGDGETIHLADPYFNIDRIGCLRTYGPKQHISDIVDATAVATSSDGWVEEMTLSVQHVAYPRRYTYTLRRRDQITGPAQERDFGNTAPAWVGEHPSIRATSDQAAIRITQRPDSTIVKLWDLTDPRRWDAPTAVVQHLDYTEAARRAADVLDHDPRSAAVQDFLHALR